jgi:hypothetical protein
MVIALVGALCSMSAAPLAWAADPQPVQETAATAATTASDDEVVCKKLPVTGSRVQKEKVCKTKSEWRSESESTKSAMRDIERRGATNLTPSGN